MTQLERILATLRGDFPEVMPWVADLTYWHSAHRSLGDLPERWTGEKGLLNLHRELGVAALCDYGCVCYRQVDDGDLLVDRKEKNGITTTILSTPVGAISCRQRFLPRSQCVAYLDYYVKSADDLAVVRYIAEQRRYEPDFATFDKAREEWAGLGPVVALPPRSPLSALFAEWAGVERTCYLLADDRAEVEKTLEALAEMQDRALALLAESPAEVIEFPDNLSAANHASFFDRFLLPHYQPRVEMLHAAGKIVGAHLDGTLRGLLERMPETGMDFVESVTPAPVGDVPVADLRAFVPADFVLIGGVPGASFAPPWTWSQLEAYVREILRHHAHSAFILGTADQVPPDGNIEWVGRITQLLATLRKGV